MKHALVILLLVVLIASPIAQTTSTQARHVEATGEPIVTLIIPGEGALTVETRRTPPLEVGPPPGTPRLHWLFQIADIVLLAQVDDVESRLTKNEDWITATIRVSALEVMKAPSWFPLNAGDQLSFEADGGAVVVGTTLVTAVLPWERSMEQYKRYYVFARVDRATKTVLFGSGSVYAIESGRLTKLKVSAGAPDSIEQSSEGDVLARLRELAARSR